MKHGYRMLQIQFFCDGLSDGQWHTMYIKRRADYIEAWVDDCPHVIGAFKNISQMYHCELRNDAIVHLIAMTSFFHSVQINSQCIGR